ncbi:MAG TPA: bacillithiol biosynthesis cysteine-adding enzyme BshC [Vicinamibacterales bacterium]|nr:bacillithiol biosynthesis cysteine-adding enzyme BshC [Vicinamibacterales bacterium]
MFREALREYGAVSAETTFADGSTRTAIDVRRFSWIRPLAGDYAFNFANVASLYAGDPSSRHAWSDAIARRRAVPRAHEEVAALLAAQQVRRNAPAASHDAVRTLAAPATVAILTGQQAGAFGGPLFTLLKAITAMQLARNIAREQRIDVVPVFWVDAEDHDWDEIASCTVLDPSFQPRTVTLPSPEGAGERPIALLTLDDGVEPTLDELQAALGQTEFSDGVQAALRGAYRPGVGMADAFARWLESVLGPYGLVVFDSSDPAAKPLVADLFARELRDAGRTATLAAAAGEALAARGHQPQVVPHHDSIALFHMSDGRRPIKRQGDSFVAGDRQFTADALLAEVAASPDRFSPNVLLRPLVQDTLFPTICYVAGPSELAYLGQLREVYDHFGVPMPLMYPRATATLVDSATARFLARHDVPLQDLQPQDESGLNRLLEAQIPKSVEQAIKNAEDAVREKMGAVIDAMPAVDPTLAGAARTTLGKMEHDLRGLHGKMIQAAKKRDETLRRQFMRAQAQIFPLGQPQERTLGVVYFLNRYGPAVIDRLFSELPLELGQHWIITI